LEDALVYKTNTRMLAVYKTLEKDLYGMQLNKSVLLHPQQPPPQLPPQLPQQKQLQPPQQLLEDAVELNIHQSAALNN